MTRYTERSPAIQIIMKSFVLSGTYCLGARIKIVHVWLNIIQYKQITVSTWS